MGNTFLLYIFVTVEVIVKTLALSGAGSNEKRVSRTLEEKYNIIKSYESGESPTRTMERFQIKKNAYYSVRRRAESIKKAYINGSVKSSAKRLRFSTLEDVDKELLTFLHTCLDSRVPVSGKILLQKALWIAENLGSAHRPDMSWICRWKKRHGIVQKSFHGEAASADTEGAAHFLRATLPMLLSRYEPGDIYNADETGLFYRCLPGKTHAFKNSRCIGGKLSKERVTVLLAASMEGEKLTPLVIGKSASPRCFKGVSIFPHIIYKAQPKAWMSGEIFRDWVLTVDSMMAESGRKIALIVDNCSAHPHVDNLQAIELIFLPPNTTSRIQPLDAGIIRAFKAHYRKELSQRHLVEFENGMTLQVDILLSLRLLESAWESVSATTIQKCFRHAGFSAGEEIVDRESDAERMEELDEWDTLVGSDQSFAEYISVDDGVVVRSDEVSVGDTDVPNDQDTNENVDDPPVPSLPVRPTKEYLILQKIREMRALMVSDTKFSSQVPIVNQLEQEILAIRSLRRIQ